MKGVSGWSIFMVPYLTPRSDSFNASDSSSHLTVARFEPLLGAAADGDAILDKKSAAKRGRRLSILCSFFHM